MNKIVVSKRDAQQLRQWAREDQMTPERYLLLMFAGERIARKSRPLGRAFRPFAKVPDFSDEEDT